MNRKVSNLFSRKFILTLLATVIGIATLLTNTHDWKVQIVALVVVLVAQVVYNVIEGNIDAKTAVKQTTTTLDQINEIIQNIQSEPAKGSTDIDKTLDAVQAAQTADKQ